MAIENADRDLPVVLIVDDHALVRSALRRTLRDLPVVVREAGSAEEALTWLAGQTSVAAVISDLDMRSGASGLELLEQVQARFPGAACFLHTGTHVLSIEIWREAWVTIIAKPVAPDLLRRLISREVAA
jgi:DNA-binding NtrC family response regulator